jgi:hypothetical protein
MSTGLDFSQYEESKAVSIFNEGVAGLVENTTLSIKDVEPGNNRPDFNLIHTDSEGRELRGASIWELKGTEDPEQLKKTIQNMGRTWRACMGDTPFLVNPTMRQFWTAIANSGNTFNVFCTYGTLEKPSQYLSPRKYDFIQATGSAKPLTVKTTDNMVRVKPDVEETTSEATTSDSLPF